jgi:Zn-dependent peptidase ImmA (M78 family)
MRAETEAQRLVAKLGLQAPPVDVESIAKALSVRVEGADLDPDVSGVLVRAKGLAIIGVNADNAPNRRRFTIAHELGHFVLHRGGTYIDKGIFARFRDSESGSGTSREEREANAFAAALLMPADWVQTEFSSRPFDLADDCALQELSSLFGVSSQAMLYRLNNLRLL